MPIAGIGLLFGSALLHTTWNLLIKQGDNKSMATWWAILIGSLLFLPAVFILGLPAPSTWWMVLASALAGACFFVVLPVAYADEDFSLVYPLARGAAPALIAVWSVLFLRERPTAGGLLGLAVIVTGLLIVGSSGWIARRSAGHAVPTGGKPGIRQGIWAALLLALIISVYSVIDGAAVKRTDPLPYAALIYLVSSIYMTPYLLRRHGWLALRQEFARSGWRLALIGGLIVTAYLLALLAYRLSTVSYAGAIREVNVVVGATAGWGLLKEKLGPIRVVGAVVIFAGILLIAILG